MPPEDYAAHWAVVQARGGIRCVERTLRRMLEAGAGPTAFPPVLCMAGDLITLGYAASCSGGEQPAATAAGQVPPVQRSRQRSARQAALQPQQQQQRQQERCAAAGQVLADSCSLLMTAVKLARLTRLRLQRLSAEAAATMSAGQLVAREMANAVADQIALAARTIAVLKTVEVMPGLVHELHGDQQHQQVGLPGLPRCWQHHPG